MNPFTLLIIFFYLANLFQATLIELFNLASLKPQLPQEFKSFYSPAKYRRSIKYQQSLARFNLIRTTATSISFLLFFILNGFALINNLTQQLSPSPLLNPLVFSFLLLLLSNLVQLPFDSYLTFSIEAKFGFNRSTLSTFITDQIKSLLITTLILGFLLTLTASVFSHLGTHAWLLAWLLIILVQLFLTFIAPTIILPLFNRFTPLENNSLRQKIQQLAQSNQIKLKEIYVMDGSRRSTKSNAFFTGIGPLKRIALFDTLIQKHTSEELITILAHEIGHYRLGHIKNMLLLNSALTGLLLYLASYLIKQPQLYLAFGLNHFPIYAGIIFAWLFIQPLINLFISPLVNFVSRHHEFSADRFATVTTGKPKTLIRALKKLATDNLSNLTPHPLKVIFSYSHPPIIERIHAIDKLNPTNPSHSPPPTPND